jgi:hypothetical protein
MLLKSSRKVIFSTTPRDLAATAEEATPKVLVFEDTQETRLAYVAPEALAARYGLNSELAGAAQKSPVGAPA